MDLSYIFKTWSAKNDYQNIDKISTLKAQQEQLCQQVLLAKGDKVITKIDRKHLFTGIQYINTKYKNIFVHVPI